MAHQAVLVAIGCLLASFAAAQESACPEGWVLLSYRNGNDSECYRYYGKEVDWESAKSACEQAAANASLVSIRAIGENKAVYDLWASYQNEPIKPGFWIGLQRQINAKGFSWWQWTDGPQTDFKNWNPDQPAAATNDVKSKDCVELSIMGDTPYSQQKWTTRRCSQLRSYMCNMPTNY